MIFSADDKLIFLDLTTTYPEVLGVTSDQEDIFVFDVSADQKYLGTGMRNGEVTIWEFLEDGEDQGSENDYSLLLYVGIAIVSCILLIVTLIVIKFCCCQSSAKVSKISNTRPELEQNKN